MFCSWEVSAELPFNWSEAWTDEDAATGGKPSTDEKSALHRTLRVQRMGWLERMII